MVDNPPRMATRVVRTHLVALLFVGALLLAAGCGGGGGSDSASKDSASGLNGVQEELIASAAAQLAEATDDPSIIAPAPAPSDYPHAAAKEASADLGPGGIPPASAGTNGSYDPPSPGEQRRIAARTHPAAGLFSPERTAILLGGTALAPPGAPERIKGMISAANLIADKPYKWGGGHGGWIDNGYDCSGAVSYALAGGGLISRPATSGELQHWGVPGPGKWLTIYANAGHTYAVIAGLRWDTVGDAKGSGPRWHPFDAYPQGFEARHLPGY
jgi:cell wall-associated NlpC family hydrolase